MQYLRVDNLSKRYGDKVLFENLSFVINKSEKVAFVASNGAGKTSLIKMLCGVESAENGDIQFSKDIRIDFLMQEPYLDPKMNILESILSSDNPATKAILDYEKALLSKDDTNALSKATQKMEAIRAWDYESRVKEILYKLKIFDFDKSVGVLSGGEKKRVMLASILSNEPDFLILDEPTNHLDLDMIEWLEVFLNKMNISIFMVTHDRYFLENICDRIIELDGGVLYNYTGNYLDYIYKKQLRIENENVTISKAKNLLKTEMEWMRKSPKARGTKSKSRINSFYDLKEKAQKKMYKKQLEFDIQPERLGNKIVEVHNVGKSYGNKLLFEGFNYKFQRFDKVGIIGINGSGKSTFLDIITQKVKSDTGKVVIGDTIKFGIYNQKGIEVAEGKRLVEVVRERGEFLPTSSGGKILAAQLLEKFLFPRSQHFILISKLSGGEKRRLYLLMILIENPNFLILDEPTNDLDITTLQVLEIFLSEFKGCLLIVSHDRYFMDKLVDHVFVFNEGRIIDFSGNYTEYRNYLLEQKENEANAKASEKISKEEDSSEKLNYEERKTFNRLEKEIEKLELKKKKLAEDMLIHNLDFEKVGTLNKELKETEKIIDEKAILWMKMGNKL